MEDAKNNTWNNWLGEAFIAGGSAGGQLPCLVEMRLPGSFAATPGTDIDGFRLIAQVVLCKSRIAGAMAEHALKMLAAAQVRDDGPASDPREALQAPTFVDVLRVGVSSPRQARQRAGSSACRDHLYILRYSTDSSVVKIGRSQDVERRRRSLELSHDFFVHVVEIFEHQGRWERPVHRRLLRFRSRDYSKRTSRNCRERS